MGNDTAWYTALRGHLTATHKSSQHWFISVRMRNFPVVERRIPGIDKQAGMTAHLLLPRLALLSLCSLFAAAPNCAQESEHKITFTFDYDFRATPACSAQVKEACVRQFNFYDISQGIAKRVKLGSMSVPAGASGLVKGISGTSESQLFNSGRHLVAVAAQMPNGVESDLSKCATIVRIP
jgi:hypothetical protein